MSTWKCLYYALVCCLGSHTFKWLVGGIYSLPNTSSRWTESGSFLSTGTPDSPARTRHTLFSVWCLPCQSTVGVCSSRPLDPTVSHIVKCTLDSPVLQPESARCGHLCADCPGVPPDSPVHTGHGTVHCSVCHQGTGWLPTSWISSLIFWASFVLESWTSKLFSSFEVLHPQCLSPILFASCELQT
jgi:hypothetical protein